MYARVAVASTALDLGNVSSPVANSLTEILLEQLLAHGRLVFHSDAEALDFVKAIKSGPGLPQGARARWTETLVHLKRNHRVVIASRPGTTPLASVQTIDTLRAGWGSSADLAVIAESACELLGVPAETGVRSDPGVAPDVAIAATATSAPALIRINDLQQQSFARADSDRDDFWEQVLGPLATDARTATVLDGYLFCCVADIECGKRRAARSGEHIAWLLEHLDSVMSGGSTVRLIGNARSLPRDHDAQAVAEAVRNQWGPLNIGRLETVQVILSEPQGGRFPHDRHIRFDTGSAIKINAGFDRLREERLWDRSGMWWSYHWKPSAIAELKRDEQTAENLPLRSEAFALSR